MPCSNCLPHLSIPDRKPDEPLFSYTKRKIGDNLIEEIIPLTKKFTIPYICSNCDCVFVKPLNHL